MRRYFIACLLMFPGLSQAAPRDPKADGARIEKLIEALASPTFSERERANQELMALKGAALEPLHQALAAPRSLEFQRRARAILDALAIYEPGGDIVNGLKVRLTTEARGVKAGDTIKLVTILCNMTDKPLNVLVGHETCGNFFECGSAVHRADSAPGAGIPAKCQVGYCGTGAGPIYVTLAPKSVTRYETTTAVGRHPGGKSLYTLGALKHFTIEGGGGADELRMVLSVTPGGSPRPARPGLKGSGVRPTDEDAPFWHGVIRSNDLRITLAP